MLPKKVQDNRLSKVMQKYQLSTKQQPPRQLEQTSFLQEYSMQSDKSTKYGSQLEARSTSTSSQQMDESKALKILLEEPEVLLNKKVVKLRTQYIPTSNGIRFILLIEESLINISWIHSIKEIEAGKLLVLYYDLRNFGEKKITMESIVLQMGRTKGSSLFSALAFMHGRYHDQQIEKLYHYLC